MHYIYAHFHHIYAQVHFEHWVQSNLLSPSTKSGGDIGMVSVRSSVHPSGISDHYLEKWSLNSFQIWCMHFLGECSELIRFWPTLAKFWHSNDQKNWPKMGQNGWFPTIISKSIHTIQFKLVLYTCWVSVQSWFNFGRCWRNFGPLVSNKLLI